MQNELFDEEAAGGVPVWARAGAAGLIGTFLGVALSLVWQFILARALGPAGLGNISLGFSLFVVLTALLPLGLDSAAMRYISFHRGRGEAAQTLGVMHSTVYASLGLSLLVSPLLIWQSGWIAGHIFSKPDLTELLQILFLGLPLSILLQVLGSVLQGFQKIGARAFVQQTVVPGLRIIGLLGLIFILRSVHPSGVAVVIVVASALGALILAIAVLREARSAAVRGLKPAAPEASLYRYSAQAVLITAVEQVTAAAPVFLLGILSASSQVGIFGVAFRAGLVLSFFLVSLNLIAAPVTSSLFAAGKIDSVQALYRVTTRWGLTLALPLFLLLMLLAPSVMGIFGADFKAGAPALQLLALGQIINVGTGPCRWLLNVTDRQHLNVFSGLIALFAGVVLGLILIPRYGAIGAAIGAAFSVALVNLIGLVQAYRILRLQPYERAFIKPLLSALVAAVVVLVVDRAIGSSSDWVRLLVGGAAILAAYGASLLALGLEREDRTAFRTLLERPL